MIDLTDEMVVAAMAHVPGCDHDCMVDALEAALTIAEPMRRLTAEELEPGELRPCPFCGGKGERLNFDSQTDGSNRGGSCISCSRCSASTTVHFDRKEHLESSWNDRARP